MNFIKRLKNTTQDNITLLGLTIPSGGDYVEIPLQFHRRWAASNEYEAQVTSGDIVVNNGTDDYTDTVAANKYLHRLTHPIDVQQNGTTKIEDVEIINFQGDVSVTVDEENSKQANVHVVGESVEGDIYRVPFGYDSGAADKWINYEHYNADCYEVPPKIIWNSKLIGISFTNKKNNAKCKIQVYKNGTGSGQMVFEHEVNQKRWAYDTNITPVEFSRGDTIRVYIKKWSGGDDADTPVVDLDFIITDNERGSGSGKNG